MILGNVQLAIIDFSKPAKFGVILNSYQTTPEKLPTTKCTVNSPERLLYELTSEIFNSGGPKSDLWALAVTIFGILPEANPIFHKLSQNPKICLQNIVTKLGTNLPRDWAEALAANGIQITMSKYNGDVRMSIYHFSEVDCGKSI
ncbi:hypothetical protein GLAREA_12989 [Glarea lozoyensis ATCC 20868]|uniref:Protein kinase domain-containing protein n=1 Tax=Glarea lozoyensis (strain ATCC 20868 / MF5171) TaxID=1116229 RepID=S3DE73_GLAL2|nr:uncharacterized protein GLAREA_12989 [Glarea lozoyensis ATCC 20868]EPE30266.1 hypothetical protein GLAREA_12989 [Glarea lozoyensis ATCC 20868]